MFREEEYYNHYIKGKSKNDLLNNIRKLKLEIGQLKSFIENSLDGDYTNEIYKIDKNRKIIDLNINEYEKTFGKYEYSRGELKRIEFNKRLENIERIKLHEYGYFGHDTIIISVKDNEIYRSIDSSQKGQKEEKLKYNKSSLIMLLKNLNIGEWKKFYKIQLQEYAILDGQSWNIEIKFSDKERPINFYGENVYPYNYDELIHILYKSLK